MALARLAESCFSYGLTDGHRERVDWFAEFLFEHELPSGAIGLARTLNPVRGAIKQFVVQLWEYPSGTGFVGLGQDEQSLRLAGFKKLASALIQQAERPYNETLVQVDTRISQKAIAALELDGYAWQGGRLVAREETVFDVHEEESAIAAAYMRLKIGDLAHVRKELADIDDHYVGQKWGDSIKHARDLLEMTLLNVALECANRIGLTPPPQSWKKRSVEVREFLRKQAFLVEKELAFVGALYALLSEQGGHPNMSQH